MVQRSYLEFKTLISKLEADVLSGLPLDQALMMAYTIGQQDGFLDGKGAKRVCQISKWGVVERVFHSVKQAAEYNDVDEGSIQTSIRCGSFCNGKKFRFHDV